MGKRANGEGNVYRRANGMWEARITHVDPDTGQRKRRSFYGPTAASVRVKLKEARKRIDDGAPVVDAKQSVASWLAHWRATTLAASSRAASTKAQYADLSRKHLQPAPFGSITLDKLRPSDVEALILAMRAQTKTRGDDEVRALSDSTIRSTFGVLRLALDGAVRDGLLARNPAAAVKRPGIERPETKHLSAADAAKVLNAADGMRYHPALVLIATTGLRRGEALALRWEHVDLDAGTLRVAATTARVGKRLVTSTPKTERARRTVPLSPAVVAMLKKHKRQQAEERLRAANVWEDHGLVFCTEAGRPVEPRNLLREVEAAAARAGVGGVGVHSLRHAAATAWLETGTHIRAIADLLGHSSISITGDIYAATSDDIARKAVEDLSTSLGL
jgi:integrase